MQSSKVGPICITAITNNRHLGTALQPVVEQKDGNQGVTGDPSQPQPKGRFLAPPDSPVISELLQVLGTLQSLCMRPRGVYRGLKVANRRRRHPQKAESATPPER